MDELYTISAFKEYRESKKLRAGRGAAGKTAVAGMRDRAAKRVAAEVVAATDKRTLQDFVYRRSDPDATVYTDEARACIGLRRRHETVKHSVGEYVRLSAHTKNDSLG